MTKLPHLRPKKAKGKLYYYFDAGKDSNGKRVLIRLPDIKDPRFGGCYARQQAEVTRRKNRQDALTFDGLVRLYEKSPEFRALSENSQLSYCRYLQRANELWRSKKTGQSPPAKDIQRRDILTVRDRMSNTPGAANQLIRAVGALYAWAVDNEKADKNPARGVKKFKAVPHERWDEKLLKEALEDPQVGMPVALLYFTGQRIDDVVKMRWLDIRGGAIKVYVQKKDKYMWVALLPELADRIAGQSMDATTILTNANGQPWTASGLRRKLQDWARERGHKIVPHGLRKNAVDALLRSGCTAAEVSGITDQSLAMIEHYASENKFELGQAAIVKLDAYRRRTK